MPRFHPVRCVVLALIVARCAAPAAAQNASSPTPPDIAESAANADPAPPEQTVPPKPAAPPEQSAPLPGPKYFNLRYDDDFTYLDGEPGTYTPDFFDPIKNIRLGDNLRLSIGGELRFRMESETSLDFGTQEPSHDNRLLYRAFLHFDLHYRDTARMFLQLATVLAGNNDLPPRPVDENRFDLQQLFFDLKPFGDGTPLTVRAGRQELQYGRQRFVAPLDWANTRRRFDAIKLIWTAETWQFDVFYARPVIVSPEHPDRCDDNYDFYGAYFTYSGIPRHGLDLFFFATDDTRNRVNPNGAAGDVFRYTLGSRFWGNTGNWDYEALVAGQWGRWAGDSVQAWAATVQGGYTVKTWPWQPRLGAAFDFATGDDDPRPGSAVGTFDQLFPLGHAWLGLIDVIGRQNINALNVNLSAWPVEERVKAELAWHIFCLNAKEDFLYNAAGTPTRRDPQGGSGRDVGQELDFTLLWKLDVHSEILFGYSHFWDGDFIARTGASEDPDLFYLQYTYRF